MLVHYFADFYSKRKLTVKLFLVWVVWLIVGAAFYAYVLDVGWAKGFYHAISVGYSIGWGDISEASNELSQAFSVVYLLCGASFVGVALGSFASYMIAERDNWYTNELLKKAEDAAAEQNRLQFLLIWCRRNSEVLNIVVLWLAFVIAGTVGACVRHKEDNFSFINALYFSMSSLSTGGLYSIDDSAEDWEYGLIGLYCAVGIPVMGAAMCGMASLFIDVGTLDQAIDEIKQPVSEEEVTMLTKFGIADKDMTLDRLEFLVLCMVRIGAASPELIQFIISYFDELDKDGSGTLCIDEVCNRLKNVDMAGVIEEQGQVLAEKRGRVIQTKKKAITKLRSLHSLKAFKASSAKSSTSLSSTPTSINSANLKKSFPAAFSSKKIAVVEYDEGTATGESKSSSAVLENFEDIEAP